MKNINKLFTTVFLFAVSFFYSQQIPPQPVPPGGGTGGTGTGAQASPIDMYIYILGFVALALITVYTKKYKTQKI